MPREESEILDARDRIGGATYQRIATVYERLRARAMVLLLRHTALRLSDVCTMRKGRRLVGRGEVDLARFRLYTKEL